MSFNYGNDKHKSSSSYNALNPNSVYERQNDFQLDALRDKVTRLKDVKRIYVSIVTLYIESFVFRSQ